MSDFELELISNIKCLLELRKDLENYGFVYWEAIIDGKIDGLKNVLNAIGSKYDEETLKIHR